MAKFLSTRGDLLPPEIIEELQHLQDNVPVLSLAEVTQQVERELGCAVSAVFAEFDETPLASASIAQVHKAKLQHETAEVVVKVQRPNIMDRLDSDLNILHFWPGRPRKTFQTWP